MVKERSKYNLTLNIDFIQSPILVLEKERNSHYSYCY